MKLLELYNLIDNRIKQCKGKEHQLDQTVKIAIASPSIGPRATCDVRFAYFGFDWESGMFVLNPTESLVVKSEKEEVWDLAFDHIYTMSKKVSHKGNPTSDAKWAMEVLKLAKEISKK